MSQPTTIINTPFRHFYDNLPAIEQNTFIKNILDACDISLRTFYYWLDHPSAVKKPAREKIAQLAGRSETELFQTKETV